MSKKHRWHLLGHCWDRSSLRRPLRLVRHDSYLLQHAHEIVKKVLFDDLPLFVPPRHRTEIYVEALVRWRNDRPIWHRHLMLHRTREIGNRAGPLALAQHDLVRIVDEVLVRKHLEECNRLLFMGVYAMRGWLIRPAHDAVLSVIFSKRLQVLSIPRIIQFFHVLQIRRSIHNPPPYIAVSPFRNFDVA